MRTIPFSRTQEPGHPHGTGKRCCVALAARRLTRLSHLGGAARGTHLV